MTGTVFRWAVDGESPSGLTVGEGAAAALGMAHGTLISLRMGNRQAATTLNVDTSLAEDVLVLGAREADRLGVSAPAVRRFTLRLKATSPHEVRLGPVIGILVGRTRDEIRENSHGFRIFNMPWNVRSLGGIVYYFSLEDIDWRRQSVLGHLYIPDRVPVAVPPRLIPLETVSLPFPDAIYRRRFVPYDTLARIQSEMTPHVFNNPRASHKLRQAEAVRSVPSLAACVPDVEPLTDADALDGMIRRYRAVFVKRSGLGAGRGVFHVTGVPARGYRVTYRESTRAPRDAEQSVGSFADLTALLSRITGYPWRPTAWLVQRAIAPARWRNRPFDVRVVVQKDGRGRWRVNGSYVRLAAAPDSVINRGGDYVRSARFFPMKWGAKGAPMLSDVFALARRCAAALDERLGPLGDVGVDILIDDDGRPWFLEGNAGPGYRLLGPDDRDYWNQLSAPISYASYLAGFPAGTDDAGVDGPGRERARG